MKKFSKNAVWAIVIIFSLMVFYSLVAGQFQQAKEIPLSDLVAKINAGEVAEISIVDSTLEIKLKNGEEMKAEKETEAGLSETLKNYNVDPEKLKEIRIGVENRGMMNFVLGFLLPIIGPVLLIGFFIWFTARQVQRGSMQAFTFGQSRARLITPDNVKERVTFQDVAGIKEAKEELKEIVDFLKNPKKFLDIGAKIPKGALLIGVPGSGKTLLARAVAGEASVPFFHMSGSEFIEMFVGVGASRVRDTFRLAKKAAPSIIFLDEIDAVGRMRGAGLGGGHDVLLDLPDIQDRIEILKIHSKNKPFDHDVDLKVIAQRTPGFSGADLANLVNEAAIFAARQNRRRIVQLDLASSIEKVLLGPERKSKILSDKEKKISAYHEAGHGLVAASLPNADPVHKITIVPRGRAGGFTMKMPSEDRHYYSRSQFLDEIAVSLGGYVAEKIVFAELTTGASDDLKKATDIARNIVTRYGMSDKIGPIVLGDQEELIFLGREISTEKNYSEETARIVDREVKRILGEAQKKANAIITKKRAKLDEIARILVERETIEKEEFEKIIKGASAEKILTQKRTPSASLVTKPST